MLPTNSLDDVEIAMALEERVGVSIPEDLLNADLTVGDLLQTLETVLAARRALPATGEPTGRINPVSKA
jgi:hypothetical protein